MNDLLNKYGVRGYAAGGQATSMTDDQLASIYAYLQTNPSAADLAAAQQQFGVSNTDLIAAQQYGASQAAAAGQPVVGPGSDNFQMAGGTTAEGYSRDYTPEQRLGINKAWMRAQQDPSYGVEGLMRDMEKTGVTVQDLALSYGMDPGSVGQYLIRHGADPSFGGIDTNWDRQAQDEFIRWQAQQRDQFGNIIGETWAKQGITDPYSDPLIRARAQEQVERNARRQALRSGAGVGGDGGGGGGGGGYTPPPPPGPPAPPPGPSVPPPYNPPPFNPPPVVSPPVPFTGPGGTVYPNTIQTSSGPQPTYFPTSWWTGSPSASLAYGMTAQSTAPDFNAQMEEYRKKFAPVYTLPAAPPPAQAPAPAPAPAAAADSGTPSTPPAPGYIWQRNPVTQQWEQVPDPTVQGAATGGAVAELWDKYHG